MEIELNTQEIYEKIYDFLLEKGLIHTAFVLKNEANVLNQSQKLENNSSLLTIFAKGKLFEQYEDEQVQQLDSDIDSISQHGLQYYIDQRLMKLQNINPNEITKQMEQKKFTVEKIQEAEKQPQLESFLKFLIYDDFILGYNRKNQILVHFNFVNANEKNLRTFKFKPIKGEFIFFRHLCIQQKSQIFLINLDSFKFQKQITINDNNEINSINYLHEKYILLTKQFTLIMNENLENEILIPQNIKKVVESSNSLYLFSNELKILYEYQILHKRLLKLHLPKNHEILNCSSNKSSNLLILLSQNQENQNIYNIFHEGQEYFLIQWRMKKFLSKIRLFEKQMIIFDDQTFHYCDLKDQQVKIRHQFKNSQIEDIYWVSEVKILIQLIGKCFKLFNLEARQFRKIEKTSHYFQILYSKKYKKLVEIENQDMYSLINLQSNF